MAFPVVESVTETTLIVAATSITADYPATVDAGDLLLILVAHDDVDEINTPTGYTLLAQDGHLTEDGQFGVFAKIADGTEDGGTINISATQTANWAVQIYRISGWSGGGVENVGVAIQEDTGSSVALPTGSSLLGDNDNLFIVAGGSFDDAATMTALPANYANLQNTIANAGANVSCTVWSGTRNLAALSDSPADGTLDLSESSVTVTIVVPPAPSGAIITQTTLQAILGGSSQGAHSSLLRLAAVYGQMLPLARLAVVMDETPQPGGDKNWMQFG